MASKAVVVSGGIGATLTAMALGIAAPNIAEFEGTKYSPYRDVVGVLTVCTGHTGKDIVVGKVYTDEECKALTTKDAAIAAEGVLAVSPHLLFHPMQLAAMISFSFNVGTGTYKTSTVAKLINQGDFIGACNFLPNYKYAGGKVVQGLLTRRNREKEICLSTLTIEGYKNAKLP